MQLYPALTQRLRHQHEAIRHITAHVDHKGLTTNPAPQKWRIKDNLAHLARYQHVFIDRIKQIMEHDEPTFNPYRAESDPDFTTWQMHDVEGLLERLYHDRKVLADFVEALNTTQLQRTGMHKKYGRLTVVQWTEFFLLHEAHHIYTIFQLAHDQELQRI